MRVAVVQFAPKIGLVQENIQTARKLCEKLTPHSVDLVCLPEMIFTGYVFPDALSITPHLEQRGTGYPERLVDGEAETIDAPDGTTTTPVGANSAVLYGPDGTLVGGYRKTNLYETDMTWAKAGTGFATFNLPPPLNTVGLGICMDLNVQPPAQWALETGPYEIADYCVSKKINILILLNAWLDSGVDQNDKRDWDTLNYWAARLRPLWARPLAVSSLDSINEVNSTQHDTETVVVICNRCGEENGITFAGTSSIFRMIQGSGRPRLLHAMERREEGVAIWDVLSER